jgi:hypothetical protein
MFSDAFKLAGIRMKQTRTGSKIPRTGMTFQRMPVAIPAIENKLPVTAQRF